MQRRHRLKLKVSQRWAIGSMFFLVLSGCIYLFLSLGKTEKVKAANPTQLITTGSFIINMGISPQTYSNGLKPYGMIYELLNTYKVPIYWVINDAKAKDATDFTHNGVNYSGGPFIVPQEYISTTVATRITYWLTQGISGAYSVSPISVPVYSTLTMFPTVMIDNLSNKQSIIAQYYTNAGIPAAAYSYGNPATLTGCTDIWTNPHGDPAWATHSYLKNFVTVERILKYVHSVTQLVCLKVVKTLRVVHS